MKKYPSNIGSFEVRDTLVQFQGVIVLRIYKSKFTFWDCISAAMIILEQNSFDWDLIKKINVTFRKHADCLIKIKVSDKYDERPDLNIKFIETNGSFARISNSFNMYDAICSIGRHEKTKEVGESFFKNLEIRPKRDYYCEIGYSK